MSAGAQGPVEPQVPSTQHENVDPSVLEPTFMDDDMVTPEELAERDRILAEGASNRPEKFNHTPEMEKLITLTINDLKKFLWDRKWDTSENGSNTELFRKTTQRNDALENMARKMNPEAKDFTKVRVPIPAIFAHVIEAKEKLQQLENTDISKTRRQYDNIAKDLGRNIETLNALMKQYHANLAPETFISDQWIKRYISAIVLSTKYKDDSSVLEYAEKFGIAKNTASTVG